MNLWLVIKEQQISRLILCYRVESDQVWTCGSDICLNIIQKANLDLCDLQVLDVRSDGKS